jgi:hypothetical protein
MKSNLRKRRRPRSEASRRAIPYRELEKLMKQIRAEQVALESIPVEPPHRKIIE